MALDIYMFCHAAVIVFSDRKAQIHITFGASLSGSVRCAVRLETRSSRVQPLPRSATFFRGD